MKKLLVSRRAALCLAILAALAWPAAGRAQGIFGSTTPAPAAQDSATPGPQAIPLPEVPLKTDEALARLQTIETQLSVDPDLALIEDELPDELAAVSRAHDRLRRIVMENISLRELWNLTAIWQSHEERLGGWTEAFEDELRSVARAAEAGRGIRDTWRLTSESIVREEAVPRPLVEQTDRVLSATDSLETIIVGRLAYLLGVKSELDDGLVGVRQVLGELEAARTSVRGRMLSATRRRCGRPLRSGTNPCLRERLASGVKNATPSPPSPRRTPGSSCSAPFCSSCSCFLRFDFVSESALSWIRQTRW